MAMPELAGSDAAGADGQELRQLVAAAADLCLKPHRHAVRYSGEPARSDAQSSDCSLFIEARDGTGSRVEGAEWELEIYRSGSELNLMLTRLGDEQAPMLWHGSHAVWMHGDSGLRCERPPDGAPLEALCRRLRALLITSP